MFRWEYWSQNSQHFPPSALICSFWELYRYVPLSYHIISNFPYRNFLHTRSVTFAACHWVVYECDDDLQKRENKLLHFAQDLPPLFLRTT